MPAVAAGVLVPTLSIVPTDDNSNSAVSIRVVAATAGVSIATVSRVINDSPAVAPATAAKVREVINRLGYVPNPMAKAFSSRESHIIGLALPRFHGEFMSWLLDGADEEATRLGYHLMMTTIAKSDDGTVRNHIVGSLLIDALLVVITEQDDPITEDVLASGVPTVVLDTDMSAQGLDSVVLDNEKGTREAVDHLLRWVEPSSLYFAGGPATNFDTQQRARAFAAALEARGVTPAPGQIEMGDYSLEWGKEWALRMSRKGKLAGAVLAANDKIACGIMHAAADLKVLVPDQLRVVGFNDSQISRLVRPRLSTVALPMAELGALAVRTLVRRIEQPNAEAHCVKLPTKLLIRESSTAVHF